MQLGLVSYLTTLSNISLSANWGSCSGCSGLLRVKWCSATNGTVEQWNWDGVSGSLRVLVIILGSSWDQSTNIHGHQCLLSIYSVLKKSFIFEAHNNPKLGSLIPKTDEITVDWEVKGLLSKAARKCWSKDSNPGNLPAGSEDSQQTTSLPEGSI